MSHIPSAFRIEQAMSAAMSLVARLQADDPDTDVAALQAAIETETDAVELLRRVIRAALEAEAFVAAAKARIAALEARMDRFDRLEEACRGTAYAMLDALALPGLKDAEFTATIQKGRRSIIITDETALPDEYIDIVRKPNRTEIASAMKEGVIVPGAEFSNGLPTLSIRKV